MLPFIQNETHSSFVNTSAIDTETNKKVIDALVEHDKSMYNNIIGSLRLVIKFSFLFKVP